MRPVTAGLAYTKRDIPDYEILRGAKVVFSGDRDGDFIHEMIEQYR